MSEPAAIAVTSGVFGIWHIRPTAAALRVNGFADDRRQATARVAAATTAGGALFSWLRARSGSLLAPVLLHLATNCVGPVIAWAVAHERDVKPPPRSQRRPAQESLSGSGAGNGAGIAGRRRRSAATAMRLP